MPKPNWQVFPELNPYNLKTRKQIEAAVARAVKNVKELIDMKLVEHAMPHRKKVSSDRPSKEEGEHLRRACNKSPMNFNWRRN